MSKYVILEKSIEGKIIDFLANNPNPPDKKIHDLSDKMGIETDKFEARVYGILSDIIEHGKGVNPNSKELDAGIKVESEHTKYPEVARYIALAHLKEFKNYYTELAKMEQKLRNGQEKD